MVFTFCALTTSAQKTTLPSTFKGVRCNNIYWPESLAPLFDKLHRQQHVRMLIIGDSHVNGNILPQQIRNTLYSYFNNDKHNCLEIEYIGKDGAWARRFNKEDYLQKIKAYQPDFVVIAFGTNEAHNTTVNKASIMRTYNSLVNNIRKDSRNCIVLLTTPPGSHIKYRANKNSRRYELRPNLNTKYVVEAICGFGKANNIAVWDLFNIAGGVRYFSSNWKGNDMMRPDGVHFKNTGYELQGGLLGDAIITAYNNYINSKEKTECNPNKKK